MSTEKKVVFTAQDGVTQKANQMYNTILANARKYTDSLKEQTNYINQQLKALEKKAQLESKVAAGNIKEQDTLFRHASSKEQQDKYRSRIEDTKRGLSESGAVIETLRGLLAEAKKQSSLTEKAEKESTKKIRVANDRFQAQRSLWRQEVQYDKGGVRKRVSAAEKAGFEGMDPQQAEKLMYQKTLIGEDKKKEGIFGQVFAGVLAAGIVQKIGSAMNTMVSAQTGEQAFNSLLGALPGIGGVMSAAATRHFDESYAVETGTNRLKAMTGNRSLSIGGNTNLGFSTKENVESAASLITASGRSGGYDQYGRQSRILERGLGLSQQSIIQMVKDTRTAGSTSDITQMASDIIRANPELMKNQLHFSEILAQTSSLTNQLASQTENINQPQIAGIVGALRSIGGSFSDPNLGGKNMMSINQALTNPGSDYQKARSFGVLSGLKPGMSYFQMMEAQEKGIGQEGYLESTLKQLERETGGGENLMLAVQQNLGLNYSTSRKLVEERAKNPSIFANFKGGVDDIEKKLNISKAAEELTSKKEKQQAEQSDAYLEGMWSGIAESFSQTAGVFSEAVGKFYDIITSEKPPKGDSKNPSAIPTNDTIE